MSSFSSFDIFPYPFVDNKRVRKYINTKFHGMSKHEINNFHTNVCFQTVLSHTMKENILCFMFLLKLVVVNYPSLL